MTLAATRTDWLTLGEASALLGVHPITLRNWVDAGVVHAFRTPGRHRRFRRAELAEFMEQQRTIPGNRALVSAPDQTLQRMRHEMNASPIQQATWYTQLSLTQRATQRELGQRLLGLLLQFVGRRENAQHFLQEAQSLARQYGTLLAQAELNSSEIVRAFLFFRRTVINATYNPETAQLQTDADGVRLLERLNTFMDELLIAMLDAYDEVKQPLALAIAPVSIAQPPKRKRSGSHPSKRRG